MPTNLGEVLQRIYRLAVQQYRTVHVTTSPLLEEQTYWNSPPFYNLHADTTPSLEFTEAPDHLVCVPITDSPAFAADSPLRYFLDGSQRTRLLFVVDNVPVCYTTNAATVVQRRHPGAGLELYPARPRTSSAILLPCVPATRLLWDALNEDGMQVEDTLPIPTPDTAVAEALATNFDACRHLAYNRARLLREELERQVVADWFQTRSDGWLVIDGNLRHFGIEILDAPIVGIIKEHQRTYFTGPAQALLLGLPAFTRSNVFCFPTATEHGAHMQSSFFLRRQPRHLVDDLDYGLLRVETSFSMTSLQAQQLSRWLIAENRPVCSGRNGNHLYPIANAERLAKRMVKDCWRAVPTRWI